jgi:anti-sigma-K factor RskA
MNINEYISSGIIEMYVMGLCNAEEKQELETLRRRHPALNDAILQYEKELEEKMMKRSTLPSAATDEKILKSLEALQTPVLPINANKDSTKNLSWLRPVAAAAVLLLAVSSYFNYTLYQKNKDQELTIKKAAENENIITLPLEDYNIMKDPAITPVAMYGVGIHSICRCTMFWDKKTGKLYIMIHHLPQSSSSKDYQLWAMVNDKPVSVGIIKDEIRGRFIEMPNVPGGANAFIVTLENAGGNTTPTKEETYLSGRI